MGHSHQPSSGGSPESIRAGHELTDVTIGPLLQFGIMLAVVAAVTMWAMLKLHVGMDEFLDQRSPPAHPMQVGGTTAPGPQLQANELADYRRYAAEQAARVGQYAWIDRQADVVRVPIDAAMEMVLQEGLPHRASDK